MAQPKPTGKQGRKKTSLCIGMFSPRHGHGPCMPYIGGSQAPAQLFHHTPMPETPLNTAWWSVRITADLEVGKARVWPCRVYVPYEHSVSYLSPAAPSAVLRRPLPCFHLRGAGPCSGATAAAGRAVIRPHTALSKLRFVFFSTSV